MRCQSGLRKAPAQSRDPEDGVRAWWRVPAQETALGPEPSPRAALEAPDKTDKAKVESVVS